jgi:hypothetical protein
LPGEGDLPRSHRQRDRDRVAQLAERRTIATATSAFVSCERFRRCVLRRLVRGVGLRGAVLLQSESISLTHANVELGLM